MSAIYLISNDTLAGIFSFIDVKKYPTLFKVCKLWKAIAEVVADSTYLMKVNRNIKKLTGVPRVIWQKEDDLRCIFANETYYVLENSEQKKCMLLSRSDFAETDLNEYHFLQRYKKYLIFSNQLKLLVLDSVSGKKITEYDLSTYSSNTISPIDQYGCCQIIDSKYNLFFIQIDKHHGNVNKSADMINLPKLLGFSIQSKNLSAYFKNNYLVISYEDEFFRGNIITFDKGKIECKALAPERTKHHVVNSNNYITNPTANLLLLYEYKDGKWNMKWGKLTSENWFTYDNTIFICSSENNQRTLCAWHLCKKQSNFLLPSCGELKTNFYHEGLLYLFFQNRLFIYDLENDQLAGKFGFPFIYKDNFAINESTFLSEGVITFNKKDETQTITTGLLTYVPLESQENPLESNSSQKLLIFKVAIVVGTIFSILSLVHKSKF